MLRLYNTLTRRKEPFEPIEPGLVKIYSCGPTVYRYIHIGNLRTFLMVDWLRRALAAQGFEVLHIKNITDVGHMRVEQLDRGEDKLIAQARKEGKSSQAIAAFYTAAFMDDERRMNILPAHVFPRATDHIPEMIAIIADLERKGLAYVAGNNVYYDVTRFPSYGKLSGNRIAELLEGVRDATDPNKRNAEDFALWKAAEPGRELAWDSPWGRGFPGWHIECSAMSIKYLGTHFDIHSGGVDNIFPHHEDEIAQSEGHTGCQLVNYWVHAQHLLADGQKMAKSAGNAYTLSDIEARGFEPMALRYLFLNVHYRSRMNFTFGALRAAQVGLSRLRRRALALAAAGDEPRSPAALAPWRQLFWEALNDDLNLPRALALAWGLLRAETRPEPALHPADRLALLLEWDEVLGLGLGAYLGSAAAHPKQQRALAFAALPTAAAELVQQRESARAQSDFALADELRAQLYVQGFKLRDEPGGTLVLPRTLDDDFATISTAGQVPDASGLPDQYDISICLLAQNNLDDLQRCVESIARHACGRALELVIVENGSTDGSAELVRRLAQEGLSDATGRPITVTPLFADHNLGFAAGRIASFRACRGRLALLLDTSIELAGDIWSPVEAVFADPHVGLVGPYGLVTTDLKEFEEHLGPDVDAIEGYLMAFPRSLLPEVGYPDEKFRFYRLMDVAWSFSFKSAGYRVVALTEVAERVIKHPHREWYSLSLEEQQTRSKKNYDLFRRRWHHAESLLVANYRAQDHWFGHSHPNHCGPGHTHPYDELPPPGVAHSHVHQHWPDHAHEHLHTHR